MNNEWFDISVSLYSGMVNWPGDPAVSITPLLEIERGNACNVSLLTMGSHTGTHIDAPRHFIRDGKSLDEMPLDVTVGRARVIEINNPVVITVEELSKHHIQPGERILFKTRNSQKCWQSNKFVEDFVYISLEAARYLAEVAIKTVGVDYLSVGGFAKNGPETHLALLQAGTWIIEGLNLSQVEPGQYELYCLPLKIQNGDGAPARAVLRAL